MCFFNVFVKFFLSIDYEVFYKDELFLLVAFL